jgi:hypothetical protein
LLLSGVGFCVGAGFDSARAAGSGHGFTLSVRAALGRGWLEVYLSRQPSYSVPEVSSQNFFGTSVHSSASVRLSIRS